MPLVLSPIFLFFLAFSLMVALLWIIRRVRPQVVHSAARRMQLLSACFMALSHGSNDAQKSMGIKTLALLTFAAAGATGAPEWMMPTKPGEVPYGVIMSCAVAMASKIIRITPLQGFAAETAGAGTILVASHFGLSLSTTHCINASIMGVGTSKRISAVRWGVAANMMVVWIVTIPATATIAALVQVALGPLTGG